MYYSLQVAHVYYIEILQLIANRNIITLVCYLAQTTTVIGIQIVATVHTTIHFLNHSLLGIRHLLPKFLIFYFVNCTT